MYKQIIVLRKDLNMRKGKMVAQGAHASMAAILPVGPHAEGAITLLADNRIHQWLNGAFTKVVVGVDGEEMLLALHRQAQLAGLPCALIQDSGRTEFHGVPTHTAVAIGPATEEELRPITGDLKLL